MENQASPLTQEKRLAFWKTAFVRIARVPKTLDMEIQTLLDAIDGGMVGSDLIQEHGTDLITHMLANSPQLDEDPYLLTTGQADLLTYQPGMDWAGVGPHAPNERVVAALMHAGANPWKFDRTQNEDGTLTIAPGQTYPPFMFCLMCDDLSRASFEALLAHPDCPSVEELMRYRTEKGQTMLALAARGDGFALKRLLALGADPNQVSQGLPVIFRASTRASVLALVNAGARTDVVDGKGNSLAMHWVLDNPSFASERISALPKPARKSDLHKVSLANLVAFADNQARNKLRSAFSVMRTPAEYHWKVSGEQVDLLEVMTSEAVFGPMDAKALAITELLNKKNEWPERSLWQVAVLGELLADRAINRSTDVKALAAAIEKKNIQATPEQIEQGLARLLVVRRTLRPTSPLDHLENKVQQDILYPWNSWLDRVCQKDPQSPMMLSVFQGFSRAMQDVVRPGVYFTENSFRKMLEFAKVHPMPEKDWLFWTAMGISSGAMAKVESWEVWEETAKDHDAQWFVDPLVARAISLRRDPELSARLDRIVLTHGTPTSSSGTAPSRRF